MSEIVIYQDSNKQIKLSVQLEGETVWLTQKQMSELFDTTPQNITMHLKSVFLEGELDEISTCKDFLHVRQEGNRKVKRNQRHYNLDAIISVGYRVKSHRATQFRIWATSKLRELLVQGYVVNQQRLEQKKQEVKILKSGIQILGRAIEKKAEDEGYSWLDTFSKGLSLLDDYDHESLDKSGITNKKANYPKLKDYYNVVEAMKSEFDSDVFGKEKDENFQSSVSQILKGIGDDDFYPTIEEKAAMLLYLITKNHSFVDGNKRIAAACFLLFLENNNLLHTVNDSTIMSNEALAALTLYIASSKPEEMETVKRLTISVLNRNQE